MTAIIILSFLVAGWAAGYFVLFFRNRRLRDELRDMADDRDMQALNAHIAEGRANDALSRAIAAEADADRLAPIVRSFIESIEIITAKLPEGTVHPDISAEREALGLHEESVKLRTK
jgi:hypothetical protein